MAAIIDFLFVNLFMKIPPKNFILLMFLSEKSVYQNHLCRMLIFSDENPIY